MNADTYIVLLRSPYYLSQNEFPQLSGRKDGRTASQVKVLSSELDFLSLHGPVLQLKFEVPTRMKESWLLYSCTPVLYVQ